MQTSKEEIPSVEIIEEWYLHGWRKCW
jgi:hypothetical protein